MEAKFHPSWLQNPLKIDIEANIDFEACFFRNFRIFQKKLQTQPTLTPSKKQCFPQGKSRFFGLQVSLGGTLSELSACPKISISNPKKVPKLRSKSLKIDLNLQIENYLKFSSILVVGANERWWERFTPYLRMGPKVHPTSKDGSSLLTPQLANQPKT